MAVKIILKYLLTVIDDMAEPDCKTYTERFPDPSHHPLTIVLFSVLYSIVFIISFAGNIGVIYATVRHRSLQTVQNIFIVNLAVSDVILCILSIPLTPVTHIAKQWYFGSMLCRAVGGIQAIGLFIGTFSLCAIAVDRYFRLVIAPGSPLRKVNAIRITVVLWITSILVTLPYVYHMKMTYYPELKICGEFCTEKWPNVYSKRIYTLFVLIIQFVIPFTIMTICYQAVFSFLRRRAKSRLTSIAQQANLLYVVAATAGADSQQHKEQLTHLIEQKKRVIKQRRRVTVILVSMVVIFGITSLPHNIVSTLMEFTDSQDILTFNGSDYMYLVNLITHLSCTIEQKKERRREREGERQEEREKERKRGREKERKKNIHTSLTTR
uniref:G_PROTEIN_RECEP_F1_2 domain-containing protein n=1 Tax=Heterorhabditis bacteriophora TaxID=37862 RepID=A0A1I7WZQ5_HETBA